MKVPFLDLSYQTRAVLDEFLSQVRDLANLNCFIGGHPVEEFERAFAHYCGTRFCVALNSGSDALVLILKAAGLKPQDEVITSPFTFIATAEAVSEVATLVLADIDPETFTLAPCSVESRLTERTRAVLPVHIFGLAAAMEELTALAQRRGLLVVEDACQAHGAAVGRRKVGTLSLAAAFSFYPTKNLGAFGDAGAVTSNDEALSTKVRLWRNHGQVGPYRHQEEGRNSRMDSLQAALLSLKLRLLDEWVEERRRLAHLYRQQLQDVTALRFQREPEGYRHSYHLLAALVEKRAELAAYLAERGIETRIVYPVPLHLLKAYRRLNHKPGDLPHAEAVCERVLCFPLYPGMSEDLVLEVARAVRSFYGQ